MSAVTKIQPMFFDENGGNDLEIQFDPQQFEAVTPYTNDLNDEYQQAQDQLEHLRQQEEQIRRQAEELEELTRQEEHFKEGRANVTQQLQNYLSVLDEKAIQAQRLAEECGSAHERLENHLASIQSLNSESWSRADRKAELTRALNYIEAAEKEIDNAKPIVNGFGKKGFLKGNLSGPRFTPNTQGDFSYWLKSGFAFSLPIVGFAILAAIFFLVF